MKNSKSEASPRILSKGAPILRVKGECFAQSPWPSRSVRISNRNRTKASFHYESACRTHLMMCLQLVASQNIQFQWISEIHHIQVLDSGSFRSRDATRLKFSWLDSGFSETSCSLEGKEHNEENAITKWNKVCSTLLWCLSRWQVSSFNANSCMKNIVEPKMLFAFQSFKI